MAIEREAGPTHPVWVRRTGPGTFTGHNPRGATVAIGMADDPGAVFTPSELLKIALAGCSAVTGERPLVRALGEDYELEVRVAGESVDNRYPELAEELTLDLSALDAAARERVLTVVRRAIDGYCKVGRTIEAGATVTLEIEA